MGACARPRRRVRRLRAWEDADAVGLGPEHRGADEPSRPRPRAAGDVDPDVARGGEVRDSVRAQPRREAANRRVDRRHELRTAAPLRSAGICRRRLRRVEHPQELRWRDQDGDHGVPALDAVSSALHRDGGPNDYIELGTSSEALGHLGYMDMLAAFFKNDEQSLAPLSHGSKWRFKPHAERPFWRWLCSWARALRKPSDLGFPDGRFQLPPLDTRVTTVPSSRPFDGKLFITPASNVHEQAQERRLTIRARCERVAAAAAEDLTAPFVAWCHLNDESSLLADLIPESREVRGSHDDDEKEESSRASDRDTFAR
jgi:hypothetical protein